MRRQCELIVFAPLPFAFALALSRSLTLSLYEQLLIETGVASSVATPLADSDKRFNLNVDMVRVCVQELYSTCVHMHIWTIVPTLA